MMNVTMWGTRGSTPVWGARHMRHGGATTCVEIRLEGADSSTPERIIIDLGTGVAELGRQTSFSGSTLVVQTHLHWDHIQGFPFFGAIFDPACQLDFLAVDREGSSLHDVLRRQMQAPTFPVALEDVPASLNFESIPRSGCRQLGQLKLSWTEVWHPSGSTAWCFDYRGSKVVFSGDVELRQSTSFDDLARHAEGADLLIADAQYFDEEYTSRVGWGHSTPADVVDVAKAAGVSRLVMTHHEPCHDDEALDAKLRVARVHARSSALVVDNAYDSMVLRVGDEPVELAS